MSKVSKREAKKMMETKFQYRLPWHTTANAFISQVQKTCKRIEVID